MKRLALMMGVVFFLVVVLAAGTVFAQGKRLPDLTIEKIYLTKDCHVAVVVKNLGPGYTPDEVWTDHHPKSAGVYLYRNGTGWGGASIWKFDPAKNLKAPGGTATYVSKLKVSGTETITAEVDRWNKVTEANEGNNKRTERLTCKQHPGGRLPDLTITKIYLVKDCRVAVEVKNLGPGPVPDTVWTVHIPKSAGVYLYRNGTGWGGGTIWGFDPAKNLQPPGGTATYVSKLKVSGTETITAKVDLWDVVTEANEGNNKRTERLTCKPPPVGKCCIAGTYKGEHKDTLSATCSNPKTEKFILTITQANCGSTVLGEVKTIKSGTPTLTHTLTGTVTPAGKCCRLEGKLTEVTLSTAAGGKVIPITATLCEKGGKWYTTNGVYTDPTGCSGTFTMYLP